MTTCTGGNRVHPEIVYVGKACPLCDALAMLASERVEIVRLDADNREMCDALFAYQQAGRESAQAAK